MHSPTFNEAGHIPAGLAHWKFQRFDLYRVNPPLPRMVAALPILFCDPQTDWTDYDIHPLSEEQIPMAIRFAKANGPRTFKLYSIARMAMIPFCLLGALVCRRWASELWGTAAGWAALVLWCLNPFVLGHGPLVMPDVPAAAFGTLAAYRYSRWIHTPSWQSASLAGISIGAALLCKMTVLVFLPIWLGLWIVSKGRRASVTTSVQFLQLAAMGVLALYLVNLGYEFQKPLTPLGSFQFRSRLLSGTWQGDQHGVGNRFANSALSHIWIPLPGDYVQGIDLQMYEFDEGQRSYLCGRWQDRGWWYYHVYGLAVKTPIATLTLLAIAIAMSLFAKPANARRRDELVLLAHGVAILTLVSSQYGFSNHVRYTIPALPFFFIWMAKTLQHYGPVGITGDIWLWRVWVGQVSAAWQCIRTASHILTSSLEAREAATCISLTAIMPGGRTCCF